MFRNFLLFTVYQQSIFKFLFHQRSGCLVDGQLLKCLVCLSPNSMVTFYVAEAVLIYKSCPQFVSKIDLINITYDIIMWKIIKIVWKDTVMNSRTLSILILYIPHSGGKLFHSFYQLYTTLNYIFKNNLGCMGSSVG